MKCIDPIAVRFAILDVAGSAMLRVKNWLDCAGACESFVLHGKIRNCADCCGDDSENWIEIRMDAFKLASKITFDSDQALRLAVPVATFLMQGVSTCAKSRKVLTDA